MPVSYTHLDVYKRQRLYSLLNELVDFIYCSFDTEAKAGSFGNFNFHEIFLLQF